MKVLVTGINGFVGKILHSELLSSSHEVFGIDIESASENINAADLRDSGAITGIVQDIKPDRIVHLAGIARVDSENINEIYEINVNGTLNVLNAAITGGNNIPFLLVSSSQVYGNPDLQKEQFITEDFPVAPVNHYGASKAAAPCCYCPSIQPHRSRADSGFCCAQNSKCIQE